MDSFFLKRMPISAATEDEVVVLRTTTLIGAVLGVGWAGFMVGIAGLGPSMEGWLLASGFAAALYTGMIYSARSPRHRSVGGMVILLLTGVFHIVWMLPLAFGMGVMLSIDRERGGTLIVATALGYAAVLALVCRSWRSGIALLIGGALATVTEQRLGGGKGMCIGVGMLHATIVATMGVSTWYSIGRLGSTHECRTCGYDMRGISAPVCPECGASRQQ